MDKQSAFYQIFSRKKIDSAFIGMWIGIKEATYALLHHVDICKKKRIKFGCTYKVVFKSESNKKWKCQSVHVKWVNGSEIVIF